LLFVDNLHQLRYIEMRLPPEILEQIVQETASWRWTTAHIQLERRSREDLQA
jgi:hypothetical protein